MDTHDKDGNRRAKAYHAHRTWHNAPTCNRVYVSCANGIGVAVCCTTCGCVADVEALGMESKQENEVTT